MRGQKVLSTIFVVVPATAALMAQTVVVEATADGCRTRPGSATPRGTHWYYRVNHVDNQRCWYLASRGAEVRSHLHRELGRRGTSVVSKQVVAQQDHKLYPQTASPQMAPAAAALPQPLVGERAIPIDFAARWPDLPKFQGLDAREVATMSYAETHRATDAHQQMLSTWPFIDAEHAGLRQASAGKAIFGSVLLDGALAVALLVFAGGVFKLARQPGQPHPRDQWHQAVRQPRPRRHIRPEYAETAGRRSGSAAQPDAFVWRTPAQMDPADDLKKNLRELMQDLQRAGAVRIKPRSFAPSVRTRRAASRVPLQASG